jgi:hypothetical protein
MNFFQKPFKTGILITLCLLNACAKNKDEQADPRGIEDRPPHPVIVGSLESNVQELANEEFFAKSKCGERFKDPILAIAREIDRRQPEILKISQRPTKETENRYHNIKIGHLTVRELKNPMAPKEGWQSVKGGWAEIIQLYDIIKSSPTNDYWVQLDSHFRGHLVDEQDFYIYGKNSYLDKDSPSLVEELLKIVETCNQDPNCETPRLDRLKEFINSQPYYSHFVGRINSATERSAKRALIARFEKRLIADHSIFAFRKNETVLRNNREEFLLPLDGSVFQGIEPLVENIITEIWKEPALNAGELTPKGALKIQWTSGLPNAFRFQLSPEQGRAYVDRGEKIIQIFANPRKTTFAHEIGHVLGLPDNYFTVLNYEACEYTQWYREDDVMSNHERVRFALPEHWEKFRKHYPIGN